MPSLWQNWDVAQGVGRRNLAAKSLWAASGNQTRPLRSRISAREVRASHLSRASLWTRSRTRARSPVGARPRGSCRSAGRRRYGRRHRAFNRQGVWQVHGYAPLPLFERGTRNALKTLLIEIVLSRNRFVKSVRQLAGEEGDLPLTCAGRRRSSEASVRQAAGGGTIAVALPHRALSGRTRNGSFRQFIK